MASNFAVNTIFPGQGVVVSPLPLTGVYDYHYVVIKLKGLRSDVTPEQVLGMFKQARSTAADGAGVPPPSGVFVPTKFQQTIGEAFVVFQAIRPSFLVFFGFIQKCVSKRGACYEISKIDDLIAAMFPVELHNVVLATATSGFERPFNVRMQTPQILLSQPSVSPQYASITVGPPIANITLGHQIAGTSQPVMAQPSVIVDVPRIQQQITAQPAPLVNAPRNCLVLRGIPYSARVDDICSFMRDFTADFKKEDIIIFVNSVGLFNGVAFIEMFNEGVAGAAATRLHHESMSCGDKTRYIEVYQGTHYETMAACVFPDSKPVLAISYVPPLELYMGNGNRNEDADTTEE